MDAQVPGEVDDLPAELEQLAAHAIRNLARRVTARLVRVRHFHVGMPLQPLRQAVHLSQRQTQRLADVADGGAPAKADDVRHHGRATAAVALVDVLNDPLAFLVLDVQVDVGRLIPIRGHEPLEHQPGGDGIDH